MRERLIGRPRVVNCDFPNCLTSAPLPPIKRRFFLAIAVITRLAPAVLLAGSLAFAGCHGCRSGAAPADSPALGLVPAEATAVVRLDLERLRRSKSWQKLIRRRDQDADLRRRYGEMVREFGLDPEQDLRELVVALRPLEEPQRGAFLVVADGNFDEARLVERGRAWLAEHGGGDVREETYHGTRVYAGGADRIEVAFAGRTRMLVGGQGWTRRALDLARGSGTPVTRSALAPLLGKLEDPAALWGALALPSQARQPQGRGVLGGDFEALTAALDLEEGLALRAIAVGTRFEDAERLVERVDSAVAKAKQEALARLLGLDRVLAGIRSRRSGKDARFALTLPQEDLDRLMTQLEGLLGTLKLGQDLSKLRSLGQPRSPASRPVPLP
jgi:hypothetical protein